MWSCSARVADRRGSLVAAALVAAGLVLTGCHARPTPPLGVAEGAAPSEPERVASFGPSFSGLAADGLGALWWAGPGVSRFDPATGVLRNFTAADDAAFATQWRTVPSVHGGVWLLESGRVRRFDGERFATALPTPGDFCQLTEGGDGALLGASCDSSGVVRGVYRWADGSWQPVGLDLAGRGGSLALLGADPSGGLWFRWSQWSGAGDAFVHWDDGTWQVYDAAHGLPLGVVTVALAAGGGVWVAAEGALVRLAHGAWTPPTPDSGLADVSSMVEAEGSLWVAGTAKDAWSTTQRGEAAPVLVARWDGTSWTRYGPRSGLDLCASHDICGVSLTGAGGQVWATGRAGLFRLDGDRWTNVLPAVAPTFAQRMVVTGPDEAWVVDSGALWRLEGGRWSQSPRVGLVGNGVRDVAEGLDGTLWAATASGLARLGGTRWRDVADVVTLTGSAANMAGFSSVDVAPDGAVWALMDDGGVVRIGDGVSVPQPPLIGGGDLQVAADGTVWARGSGWGGPDAAGGLNWRGPDGRWMPEYPWGKDTATQDCGDELAVAQREVWAIRRCWGGPGTAERAELAQFDGRHWTVYHDAVGRAFGSIAGMAVTSQGSLIVAAESGLLAHDTAGWTVLLPDSYASVAVGPDDALWLTDPSGIYRYVP